MKGDAYHADIKAFTYDYEDVTHVCYDTDPYRELRFSHYDSEHLPYINCIWLQEGIDWHGYIEYDPCSDELMKKFVLHKHGKTPHEALVNLIDQLNINNADDNLRFQGVRFAMRCVGAIAHWQNVMKLLDNPI